MCCRQVDEVSDEDEDEEDEDEDDDFDEDDDEDEKPRRSRAKPRGKATNGRARGGKTTPGVTPVWGLVCFQARLCVSPRCLTCCVSDWRATLDACGAPAQIRLHSFEAFNVLLGAPLANREADVWQLHFELFATRQNADCARGGTQPSAAAAQSRRRPRRLLRRASATPRPSLAPRPRLRGTSERRHAQA